MTKKLLLAATVALAISSCTQVEVDEVATQTKEPIRFEQFVGKATRGDVVTNDNLTEFTVFVKKYKADGTEEDVVKTTVKKSGDTWTPEKVMYWEAGAKYCFAAVYKSGTSFTNFEFDAESETEYYLSYPDYYENTTSESESADVVAAVCPKAIEAKASGNEPVQFTFQHIMAKVQFTITNGHEVDELKLPEMTFKRMTNSVFILANTEPQPTWGLDEKPSVPKSINVHDITIPASESKTITLFVIPQDADAQPTLTINRQSTVGDNLSYNLLNGDVTEWEAGKAYNYKLTFTQEKVKFDVTAVNEMTGNDEVDL